METVRIYRLNGLDSATRERLRAAQMESAKVWMRCVEIHHESRANHLPWPDRDALQKATKGGQFALASQSIQMIAHRFLGCVETTQQLRNTNPRMHYPYKSKKYMPVYWPAQAVTRTSPKRIVLPMGRKRRSFSFRIDLPERIGAVSLVWRGGYELHVVVPSEEEAPAMGTAQATIDLGEIHQAAVTTSTGAALIVSGRGIRSLKRRHNMTLGELNALQSRCVKGSRRWRKLQYAKEQHGARTERQVRDLRHKGTRQVVDFLKAEGVNKVYIGDPHGVRRRPAGRHHNQRMSQWEYGRDKDYLQQKCARAHIGCFTGSERGTSSRCPKCEWHHKPRGREWKCENAACGFHGHRDLVGSMNMHPLAYGTKIDYPVRITYRRPGPIRFRTS